MYAILSHGGRQYRVTAGDRLVVDRLDAQVGSVIGLEPVLLTGGDGTTALGAEVEGLRVAVTVVAHRRGEKLRIFKYKAKKRSRTTAGYRSDLTELRVESILAKGAALPETTAGGESRPRRRSAPRKTSDEPKPAATTRSRTRRATPVAEEPDAAESTSNVTTPAATKPAAKRATRSRGSKPKETGDGA